MSIQTDELVAAVILADGSRGQLVELVTKASKATMASAATQLLIGTLDKFPKDQKCQEYRRFKCLADVARQYKDIRLSIDRGKQKVVVATKARKQRSDAGVGKAGTVKQSAKAAPAKGIAGKPPAKPDVAPSKPASFKQALDTTVSLGQTVPAQSLTRALAEQLFSLGLTPADLIADFEAVKAEAA